METLVSFPVPPAVAAATEQVSIASGQTPPTGADEAAACAGKHSLAQRLRFIDLCEEAAAIARDAFPPIREEGHGLPRIANPHFAVAYRLQRALMMRAEGLPASLCGDGKTANQRHFEKMAQLHPTGNWPAWARAQSEGEHA